MDEMKKIIMLLKMACNFNKVSCILIIFVLLVLVHYGLASDIVIDIYVYPDPPHSTLVCREFVAKGRIVSIESPQDYPEMYWITLDNGITFQYFDVSSNRCILYQRMQYQSFIENIEYYKKIGWTDEDIQKRLDSWALWMKDPTYTHKIGDFMYLYKVYDSWGESWIEVGTHKHNIFDNR
jgi:hypothetical protein